MECVYSTGGVTARRKSKQKRTGTGFTVPVLSITQLHQHARTDGLAHAHLALQLFQFGVNLGILLQFAEAVFEGTTLKLSHGICLG
jgi:hypothetical protein